MASISPSDGSAILKTRQAKVKRKCAHSSLQLTANQNVTESVTFAPVGTAFENA
jgi:hypothetical protein